MPIFEYQCQKCHRVTEVIQARSEKPLKICPHCGGKLRKLISAPAIQFKGSGWYVTDYAGKGKKPADDGGAAKSSEKKDASKKESAPKSTSSKKD
jgi:putative FmdB family regulatory protein